MRESIIHHTNRIKRRRVPAPARWICAPCDNLQPVSPTGNIVALYETIHQYGRL